MTPRKASLVIICAETVVAVATLTIHGWNIEGLQAVTRFSGRLSLLIFSLLFLFHASERIDLSVIFSSRYYLMFALAHGIHLGELVSYNLLKGDLPAPYRLAGGFVAYAFIFAMPWLANRAETGRLKTPKFRVVRTVYFYYILFIFFMTYFSRVFGSVPAGGTFQEHVALMGWVALLPFTKIAVHRFF